MNWQRIPGVDIFAANILEYPDPHLLLLWSWEGAWTLGVQKGNHTMDDDNLRLWLGIAGVPVPSAEDLAWLQEGA